MEPDTTLISRETALKVLNRLAGAWGLEQEALLASVRVQPEDYRPFDTPEIEHISNLLNIYDALHRLFDDATADQWISLPNTAFDEHSPAELLLSGEVAAIAKVRRYLDNALAR